MTNIRSTQYFYDLLEKKGITEQYKKSELKTKVLDDFLEILVKSQDDALIRGSIERLFTHTVNLSVKKAASHTPIYASVIKSLLRDYFIKVQYIENQDDIEAIIDKELNVIKDIEKREKADKQKNELALKLKTADLSELRQIIDALEAIDNDINANDYKAANVDFSKTIENIKNGVYDELHTGIETITIRKNAITTLIAPVNHGKTAFALNVFFNMLTNYPEKVFVLFGLEQNQDEVTMLLLQIASEQPEVNILHDINKDENKYNITDSLAFLSERKEQGHLYIFDQYNTVEDISNTTRKIRLDNPEKDIIIFIDYIQLISTIQKNKMKTYEFQEIEKQLINLANKQKITIVQTAQVNREGYGKKEPDKNMIPIGMTDIKDSADIEQASNQVFAVYNYYKHCYQKSQAADQEERGILRVKNLKRRGKDTPKTHLLQLQGDTIKIKSVESGNVYQDENKAPDKTQDKGPEERTEKEMKDYWSKPNG